MSRSPLARGQTCNKTASAQPLLPSLPAPPGGGLAPLPHVCAVSAASALAPACPHPVESMLRALASALRLWDREVGVGSAMVPVPPPSPSVPFIWLASPPHSHTRPHTTHTAQVDGGAFPGTCPAWRLLTRPLAPSLGRRKGGRDRETPTSHGGEGRQAGGCGLLRNVLFLFLFFKPGNIVFSSSCEEKYISMFSNKIQ